jgi:hypothetical protein
MTGITNTSAVTAVTLYQLAPPLVTLQFAAFGWRMNREINHGEGGRGHWIPIPDLLNIGSLFATVACLIVIPIATVNYLWLSRIVLGIGYVLIAFHPFTVSAHYCLWRKQDRSKYLADGKNHPYVTGEEFVLTAMSLLSAASAGAFIATH